MCQLLTLFMVVGAYEITPRMMYVELLNDGVVEEYVVPMDQYQKCDKAVWVMGT